MSNINAAGGGRRCLHNIVYLFLAGALSVLLFQMGALAILNAIGQTQGLPFDYRPTKPLGIPQIWSFCFWGGVWAQAFGCVERYFPRGFLYYVCAFLFGIVGPVMVLWFIVFPLKGLPVAAGLDPGRMLTQLIIHGCYGLGVGVLLQACRACGSERSSTGEPA
jgi:hypothetical protein